jgi:hypothetical protein
MLFTVEKKCAQNLSYFCNFSKKLSKANDRPMVENAAKIWSPCSPGPALPAAARLSTLVLLPVWRECVRPVCLGLRPTAVERASAGFAVQSQIVSAPTSVDAEKRSIDGMVRWFFLVPPKVEERA